MGGAHRAKVVPVVAARKSAAWLLMLSGLALVPLALLGLLTLGLYLAWVHNPHLSLLTTPIASVAWALNLWALVERMLRRRPHSPAQTMRVVEAGWALRASAA